MGPTAFLLTTDSLITAEFTEWSAGGCAAVGTQSCDEVFLARARGVWETHL